MGKRLVTILIFLFAIGGGVFLLYRPKNDSIPMPLLALDTITDRGWPNEQRWTWTFQIPKDSSKRIDLCVRQKSTPLPKDGTLWFHDEPIRYEDVDIDEAADRRDRLEYTIHENWNEVINSGSVTIQLVDLQEMGISSSVPDKPLRVIEKFTIGMGSQHRKGDAAAVSGKRFAGTSIYDPKVAKWVNKELRLMTFWIQDDKKMIQNDVLLRELPPFDK